MIGLLHVKQTHLKAKDGAALPGDTSQVSGTDDIRWGSSHHSKTEQWGHRSPHNKQQEATRLRANIKGHGERRGFHRQGCLQQPRHWRWTSHPQVVRTVKQGWGGGNEGQARTLCSCTRWSTFTAEKLGPQGRKGVKRWVVMTLPMAAGLREHWTLVVLSGWATEVVHGDAQLQRKVSSDFSCVQCICPQFSGRRPS